MKAPNSIVRSRFLRLFLKSILKLFYILVLGLVQIELYKLIGRVSHNQKSSKKGEIMEPQVQINVSNLDHLKKMLVY